ncbi:hypothetical protein ACEQ8H_007366 [Pleosporales sp. CAS-2024a]
MRQPFGEIGDSRFQLLQSAKNRQNAITAIFDAPLKAAPALSTGKRQREPSPDMFNHGDSENMDPLDFLSPSKKRKTTSTIELNSSGFTRIRSSIKSASVNATPSVMATRKIRTPSSVTKLTTINNSRGSPKNKRIAALSKHRASSSPFRRVDPPAFNPSRSSLPFSIDAALSGTVSRCTPTPSTISTPVSAAPASGISMLKDPVPKGWLFKIHEDTPDQEAANLMEHSAAMLDISTDDDAATKARKDKLERGKENIPPPDFVAAPPRVQLGSEGAMIDGRGTDAIEEDRRPLGDLPS